MPTSAAGLVLVLHIPELVEGGNLDVNGTVVTKSETISLSRNIPAWGKYELSWSLTVELRMQNILFECALDAVKTGNQAKLILCNTFYDLESTACDLNSILLPIGPLLNPGQSTSSLNYSSSFRTQDSLV